MKTTTWLLSLIFIGLTTSTVVASPMTHYELHLLLAGRTAECVKTKDGSLCDTFFGEDGVIKRFTYADNKRREGRWWIDDKGLNVHWTGRKKPLSFVVNDRGDGTLELVRKHKVKSIVRSIQAGNQLGW